MRPRRFPVIRQRRERRGLKEMQTYACSCTTVAFLIAFLFLLSRLAGQHRGALITLQEGSTVGPNILSEKYNDIVNAYHTTVEVVSGADSVFRDNPTSEGARLHDSRLPVSRINPADEDREPGPGAVAEVGSPGRGTTEKTLGRTVKTEKAGSDQAAAAHPDATNSTVAVNENSVKANPVHMNPATANPVAENVPQKPENTVHNEDVHNDKVTEKKEQAVMKPESENVVTEERPQASTSNAVEHQNTPPVEPKREKTLAEYLNFTEKTAINYMHFHKTGGVSFKTALFGFFLDKKKRNGEAVRLRDACYKRKVQATGNVPTFDRWRCDWAPVWEMTETERNKLDVVFGHQYWENGAQAFLNQRDMRTFTVIRHPLDRKVSFFFHFFVRERNRDETKVEFAEVRDFLLYDKIRDKSLQLGQDLGPNYMAGRLLSDGFEGFVGNSFHKHYDVKQEEKLQVAEKALRVMRKYMFIGLQSESEASKCMLRKTVDVFNAAQGIHNPTTEKVARAAKVLNTGSYSLTASKIWERLSLEERILFDRKERVDVSIYNEGERLFKQQVRQFQCEHLLKRRQLLDA